MREKQYHKYIFFNDKETAERFMSLYGGHIFNDIDYYDAWCNSYFGTGINGMVCISFRSTTKNFETIKKAINLKEKKGNGKKYFIMA